MSKINKLLIAVCIICGLTSCMDFDPKADLGDNLVWNKAENFQLFANQFYGWTRDFQQSVNYASGVSDGPHSDYRSDLICTSSINTYSQGTNAIPATDGNYTTLYKRIYYTNLLLKNAEGFSNQTAIAIPKGEALWFRAYLHFELVQIYGNVQLLTTPLDMDSEQLYEARNDRGEVIDQCVKDLQEAITLLPVTADAGRLTSGAAQALLSRIALYEGTWQKFHNNNTNRASELLNIAKNAAQQVMDGGNYQLFYNDVLGTKSYQYLFTLEDAGQCNPAGVNKNANTEYIMMTRHRDGDMMALNVTHAMVANVCYPTKKMADMFLCSDGLPISKSPLFQGYAQATSEFLNRDNRMNSVLLRHGEKYWNNDGKWRTTWTADDEASSLEVNVRSNSGYQTRKWGVERQVADYYESMDYPVIRYAEVLLNFAEATYELNEQISDADLDKSLNLVRLRVNPNMPKLTNNFVNTTGLDMREEIRRERTIELVLEGFRIDDLKRWATAPTEMPQDQLGVKITGTWFEANWTNQARSLNADGCIVLYTGRIWNDKLYLYPLPQDQLQLNPQLGQNPGWTN